MTQNNDFISSNNQEMLNQRAQNAYHEYGIDDTSIDYLKSVAQNSTDETFIENMDYEKVLEHIQKVLPNMCKYNKSTKAICAEMKITIGKCIVMIDAHVKKNKIKLKDWHKNVYKQFHSNGTIYNYKNVASIPHVEKYTFLGFNDLRKLEPHVKAVMKNSNNEKDPIAYLLKESGYIFDFETEQNREEFEYKIEKAVKNLTATKNKNTVKSKKTTAPSYNTFHENICKCADNVEDMLDDDYYFKRDMQYEETIFDVKIFLSLLDEYFPELEIEFDR